MRLKQDLERNNNPWLTFFMFSLVIHFIFLIEIFPILGIALPRGISSQNVFITLTFIAILAFFKRNVIYSKKLYAIFIPMCTYFLIITCVNSTIQQYPFYYYAPIIIYPLVTVLLMEYILYQAKLADIQKMLNYSALFIFFYFLLNTYYQFNGHGLYSASGEAMVYYVVTLLPFILSSDKQWLRNIGFLVVICTVIMCSKRTALIACILSLLVYFYVSFRNDKKKMRILCNAVIASICCIFLYNFIVEQTGNDILVRLFKLRDDGGSYRDVIYFTVFQNYKNADIFDKIFGIGFNGVRYIYNIVVAGEIISAHNDFLEVLVDYGAIGLSMYLVFIIKMWNIYTRLYRQNSRYAAPMIANIIIFMVLSCFSHLLIYLSYFINILVFCSFAEKLSTLEEKEVNTIVKCSSTNLQYSRKFRYLH